MSFRQLGYKAENYSGAPCARVVHISPRTSALAAVVTSNKGRAATFLDMR